MEIFYEKADKRIIEKCKRFVNINRTQRLNYFIYREALALYVELSQSLIDSHHDFDDAIKKATDNINALDCDIEKVGELLQFNYSQYSLILDMDAHRVLKELVMIEKNNKVW